MGFRFNRLGFFISDIISPFVRLFKLDIHLSLIAKEKLRDCVEFVSPPNLYRGRHSRERVLILAQSGDRKRSRLKWQRTCKNPGVYLCLGHDSTQTRETPVLAHYAR